MSDYLNPQISETHGPVHAGLGPQINLLGMMTDAKGRDPRRHAADELSWLRQRFIAPPGLGRARHILESHRTVFLDGPPGSGRATAAKMLLWELSSDSTMFHELVLQDRDGKRRLDLTHVGERDRLWLNLSGVDETSWREVHSELSELREAVREQAAHLVVVLPRPGGDLKPELDPYRARIEPPPLNEVLRRCLRLEGFDPSLPIEPHLLPDDARALEQIPKFVSLIVEARESAFGPDFTAWCARASEALSGQEKDVADLVRKLEHGPQRALLLATAMLHGAHADSVHDGAAALLSATGHPAEAEPMLVHKPLDVRLQEIDAELDAQGRVRFERFGFDSSVREFLRTHLPELREPLTEWVAEIVDSRTLSEDERDELVSRFARHCLTERHWPVLAGLMGRWTSPPGSARRTRAAALALLCGLQDQEHGRFFRKQIYHWSRRNDLPDPLAELIIAACRDEMAISHPDEAVVRLHHMARREHGAPRARKALIGLVDQDRRFLRQMLQRVTEPGHERRPWPADTSLFLELAAPEALTAPGSSGHPLIALGAVREQLRAGWDLAFAASSPESWTPLAWRWLTHAAAEARHRHALLDVITAGGAQRTDVLARLYTMTRRQDLHPALGDLALHKINNVQGIP